MLILGIPFPLNIPIFDRSDDMGFVRGAQLDLDLVAVTRVRMLRQKVQPPGSRLDSFLIFKYQIAQAQDCWVTGNAGLNPAFIQIGVSSQPKPIKFDVCRYSRGRRLFSRSQLFKRDDHP
jgi:hypothetical protein